MIDYEAVTIESIDFSAQGTEEVYENLRVLYTTPLGSVPFNRSFGVSTDFLDEPLPIAKGFLIVEYREKTRRFEPRATVQEVLFDEDVQTGRIIPKVVITIDLEAE
ncbi:GPW/gp25 family protein [Bacillus solitudinis]|uniref:hypothetical protein n=1 Tax=Bacillus solitudinis TaxID=2014074 RepID=UPI000C244403|nr:hypothetical protein [Bacillus solitudinis]